ncbi:MAG: glycosyltransferase family 2 protein [Terriglobia bacterium]
MNRLTATLVTHNEEQDLPRALASLKEVTDEIVVVDSGSDDRTCEIARQHGARVRERTWTDFSDQKNFAAAQATHDWVLNLDADEELSPGLREELRRWKQQAPTAAAYAMPRRARYLGRWIRHSDWYPDPKVRLYRRGQARFAGRLHESVVVEGAVGRLAGEIYHHTFGSVTEHLAQINQYTTLAAEQLFAGGRRRWLLPMLVSPPWMFVRTYVLKQGFRDGYHGWLIAQLTALTSLLKFAKLGLLVHGGARAGNSTSAAARADDAPRSR